MQRRVGAEQRTERLRGNDRADDVDVHLAAEFVGRKFKHGACHRDAGIVDQAGQGFAFQFGADIARRRRTAASSVTSNNSGVKLAPNSFFRRSASSCLRTLPNTRKPRSSSTFAVPQPMPVEVR